MSHKKTFYFGGCPLAMHAATNIIQLSCFFIDNLGVEVNENCNKFLNLNNELSYFYEFVICFSEVTTNVPMYLYWPATQKYFMKYNGKGVKA